MLIFGKFQFKIDFRNWIEWKSQKLLRKSKNFPKFKVQRNLIFHVLKVAHLIIWFSKSRFYGNSIKFNNEYQWQLKKQLKKIKLTFCFWWAANSPLILLRFLPISLAISLMFESNASFLERDELIISGNNREFSWLSNWFSWFCSTPKSDDWLPTKLKTKLLF